MAKDLTPPSPAPPLPSILQYQSSFLGCGGFPCETPVLAHSPQRQSRTSSRDSKTLKRRSLRAGDGLTSRWEVSTSSYPFFPCVLRRKPLTLAPQTLHFTLQRGIYVVSRFLQLTSPPLLCLFQVRVGSRVECVLSSYLPPSPPSLDAWMGIRWRCEAARAVREGVLSLFLKLRFLPSCSEGRVRAVGDGLFFGVNVGPSCFTLSFR